MTDESRREDAWAAAGHAAAALAQSGMAVGLGTGRAAAAAIRALGARRAAGLRVSGVATSPASATLAGSLGIPVRRLSGDLDLAFDGADAVDPHGLVVKGAGGAFVRERLVAGAARRFVVLVDRPKLVASLDEWGVLPVGVLPFALERVRRALAEHRPERRPGRSADGLAILDLHPSPGCDWAELARSALAIPGVVDHGLFRVALDDVLVGRPDGTAHAASRDEAWRG